MENYLDGFEAKHSLADIALGLKELSGKLDTLISLKEVELQRDPQPPEAIISHVVSQTLRDRLHHE